MRVQSLSQEDPLEEEMATLSNIIAWRNLVGYSPVDHKESGLTKVTARLQATRLHIKKCNITSI